MTADHDEQNGIGRAVFRQGVGSVLWKRWLRPVSFTSNPVNESSPFKDWTWSRPSCVLIRSDPPLPLPCSLLTGVLPKRRVKTRSRAASFLEVVAMILRGTLIHRNGHGQCGLLPNPTFFNNRAQLSFSGVPAHTRTTLFDHIVSSCSSKQGGAAPASIAGTENHVM